ncbi:MAG: hypothetical protein COB76_03780 [Alphaproteobacteria bacterium]|nr:MAG: hypothetical protein COB76_03780 [Alphaproteobacteria bacterium]
MLTDDPRIAGDIEWLLTNDSVFLKYFKSGFKLTRSRGEDGMAGLIRIVVGQQISTAAARSLWAKFTDKFDPLNPSDILNGSDDDLRSCGLSRQKVGYVRGLAQAILDRTIEPESWTDKDSATVIEEITALKGFGIWSAQMFLMFNLARPDVWPCGDLGVQNGLQIYLGLANRPTEKETKAKAALFTGRETAAALLLWSLKEGGV